jgi:hypothetical protein
VPEAVSTSAPAKTNNNKQSADSASESVPEAVSTSAPAKTNNKKRNITAGTAPANSNNKKQKLGGQRKKKTARGSGPVSSRRRNRANN